MSQSTFDHSYGPFETRFAMADDGPPLIRPIPRRPFALSLKSPTPPQDDDDYDSPTQELLLARFRHELHTTNFLGPDYSPPVSATTISRPQSFQNLTSSTLAGIYSPTASSHDDDFDHRSELHTPWGTGAETPVKRRPSMDEATYELMRDRSHLPHQRTLYSVAEAAPIRQTATTVGTVFSLASRAGLLFALGVGYGVLVTHFHNEQGLRPIVEGSSIIKPGNNRQYLAFWGIAGVVLGALQPWFDKYWEQTFGPEEVEEDSDKEAVPSTDWALVMRAVGAFVGIVFAIRKLAWTSTMQLSATLALVNPLLWWLIDRSQPGFVLSAGVALVGSIFLLGVDPEIMPTPSSSLVRNASVDADISLMLGGLASQETVETGIWMLSVLFCSSLCFGNIGRRLAWGESAVARGRWGGMR